MKNSLTGTLQDGKRILKYQCEGKTFEEIKEILKSSQVIGYSLPVRHSLQTAWLFRLYFNNGVLVEFSSACTVVKGWQEAGSLNIKFMDGCISNPEIITLNNSFIVSSIQGLAYEDDDVHTECGIIFIDKNGNEIIIATGVPPGSVSVQAPFSKDIFQPEFTLLECRRVFV